MHVDTALLPCRTDCEKRQTDRRQKGKGEEEREGQREKRKTEEGRIRMKNTGKELGIGRKLWEEIGRLWKKMEENGKELNRFEE